jgi:hypothetical protein
LVYSALDSEGNKIGNPVKSSSIARSVGHAALTKKVVSSEKLSREKQLTGRVKPILDTAIKNYRNRSSFEKELLRNGISVVFRENEDGRIYGATFIDHETRTVFNGSKIGRAYSANVFHNLFQNSREDEPLLASHQEAKSMEESREIPSSALELDITMPSKGREDSEMPDGDFPENTYDRESDDTAFYGLPSLLEQHGTDYEAEAFARKKEAEAKRRKRRGRRM